MVLGGAMAFIHPVMAGYYRGQGSAEAIDTQTSDELKAVKSVLEKLVESGSEESRKTAALQAIVQSNTKRIERLEIRSN